MPRTPSTPMSMSTPACVVADCTPAGPSSASPAGPEHNHDHPSSATEIQSPSSPSPRCKRSLSPPTHGPMCPIRPIRSSITSRTHSLPASPLDDIPEKLWPRVLRTLTTPETSNPDLSLEEITSTRLSLDDQAILTSLPNGHAHAPPQTPVPRRTRTLRRGVGGFWEDRSQRWKKMTKRLRTLPSGIFTRSSPAVPDTSLQIRATDSGGSTLSLPSLDLTTDVSLPPDTRLSQYPAVDAENIKPMRMDYEGNPTKTESSADECAKISSIIRRDIHDAIQLERGVSSAVSGKRVPHHFQTPPTYGYVASPSTGASLYTAEDRLLHGPRSLKAFSRQTLPTAASIGSIEEMRSHAFGNRRLSRPSMSNIAPRQLSAPAVERISRSSSRPGTTTNANSNCNSNASQSTGSIHAPRRPVVYMDAPSLSADFIWNGSHLRGRPSTSSTVRASSRPRSGPRPADGDADLTVALTLPPDVEVGWRDHSGYTKIPLYVPKSIERNVPTQGRNNEPRDRAESPSSPKAAHEEGDWPAFGLNSDWSNSNPAVSDLSFASIQGQTSITSRVEKEALMEEARPAELPLPRPWTGNRERLSKALAVVWSDNAVRLKASRGKRAGG